MSADDEADTFRADMEALRPQAEAAKAARAKAKAKPVGRPHLSLAPTAPKPQRVSKAPTTTEPEEGQRTVRLTSAGDFPVKRVRWLWDGRIALGTLSLIAGPEGVGKSTAGYWLAAQITRGTLPGELAGQPRAVLVCASEDSWSHTIVPRLLAHEADLKKVYRVDAVESGVTHQLDLPRDLAATEDIARQAGAALLLLDPLMSRLSTTLDTHRDGEVRQALEPLVAIAERSDMAVVGLIHHNKSGSSDPLQLIMASKAFAAVARSIHTVVKDPEDETDRIRLFGLAKNNLGRVDLPTLSFEIVGYRYPTDDGEEAWTGQLHWLGEHDGTITDAMRRANEPDTDHTATSEAADWLEDWLTDKGGTDASKNIKKAAHAEGHLERTIGRARKRLKLEIRSGGYPRATFWSLPGSVVPDVPPSQNDGTTDTTGTTESPRETHLETTTTTRKNKTVRPVVPVVPVVERQGNPAPLDPWADELS